MKIEELPLNDEFAQYIIKSRRTSEEYTMKRKEKIRNCNHLFVRLKEGETTPGFNSSDYYYDPSHVECVHCGLTNKYESFEEMFSRYPRKSYFFRKNKTIESEMFGEFFKENYCRGGKSFDESAFNLISEEVLPTYHPGLLYKLAMEINPEASMEGIFETMKQLHSLETRQESLRLQEIEQAQELLARYHQNKKSKRLGKNLKN